MCGSNKQICRLCLQLTPSCESEPIEAIKNDMLEILLININVDLSDSAVACSRCMDTVRGCFDFKSRCNNVFMNVDINVDIKKKAFESELMSHDSICQEKSRVCRLCLSLIKVEAFRCSTDWGDEFVLKDMVKNCFPKVDLSPLHESLICKPCLSNMRKYCVFMKNCDEVEQRIKRFCQVTGHGIIGKVDLAEILKFKDCDVLGELVIINNADSESVDENVPKHHKSEEIAVIKCDEFDIKDALLDNELKISDLNESEDYESSGKKVFSKTVRKASQKVSKGKKHFCPKCPYSSERRDHFTIHMCTHADNEVHECFLCPFITDTKFSLKAHMTSHKGPTKAFGCLECLYETDHKTTYLRHLLRHKDKSEVEMQKCPLCSYKTKYSAAMVTHLEMHHNISNKTMHKCNESSYNNKHKVSLVYRQVHMNPEEIPKYKCEKCEFETKYKRSLARHMIMHENPETVNKFKCDKCPYRGKRQHVKNHMLVHSDKRPFSCDQCTYSSKCMSSLVLHKHIHEKNGEMYKCQLCGYHAKNNVSLKVHMAKSHMDTSVPIMKCAHCPYETAAKPYLLNHMRRWHSSADGKHMRLGDTGTPLCNKILNPVQAETRLEKKVLLEDEEEKND